MAYIKGIGNISPQDTFDNSLFLDTVQENDQKYQICKEPNYKELLPSKARRRMSKLVKMGVCAATRSLEDASIETPDAVIVGTALGCLTDTEKFLLQVINHDEQLLTPISFIQSTHNTVAGTIAILKQCHGYNFTYVHKGFSFESALLDGMMQVNEAPGNYLIGGIDEMTEKYYQRMIHLGSWKKEAIPHSQFLDYKDDGVIPGEGSAFFILGSEKEGKSYAKLEGMHNFYKPTDSKAIQQEIEHFLTRNSKSVEDIDAVVLGLTGDKTFDKPFNDLANSYFAEQAQVYFKHLCGEYKTATSFALWLASKIAYTGKIPDIVRLNKVDRVPKNILIYNHYNNINHSLILLSHVDV